MHYYWTMYVVELPEDEGHKKMHWCLWSKLSQEKKRGGLGFKDIQCFNQAMLGKQIWRILQFPELLVSKALKAKYFPKSSIFDCKVSKNSSWFWQSIMAVRDQVEAGSRSIIGNGKNTRIWSDRWIQNSNEGLLTTEKPGNCSLQTVDELICNFMWNRNIIFRIFSKADADKILQIPISFSGRKDKLIWKYSKNGNFTVKSSYTRLLEDKDKKGREQRNTEGPSVHGNHCSLWKTLWKLKIKLKLKIFIWKCINSTLPARENTYKRTLKGDPICKGCGNGVETTEHIFFHCSKAQLIWKLAPVQWDGASEFQGNFRCWWAEISQARGRKEGYDRIALTANILWQIWKARNSLDFNEISKEEIKLIQKANSEWLEYDNVTKRSVQGSTTETTESQTTRDANGKEEKSMQIKIATVKDKASGMLGIGVIASFENVEREEL